MSARWLIIRSESCLRNGRRNKSPFREQVKQLIALRRREPVLRRGTFSLVSAGDQVFAGLRQLTNSAQQVLLMINCSDKPQPVHPAVPGA